MSFGYSGEMSDYCCMDPHSRAGFLLQAASNQAMLRSTFPPPVAAHSSNSSLKSSLVPQSQPGAEGIQKPKFEPEFESDIKNSHLSPVFPMNKNLATCMAPVGHVSPVRATLAKDKLTSRQIDTLVSEIFSSDLHYANNSASHQQQNQSNVSVPPLSSPAPVKKRSRKRKDPHQRKTNADGTRIPREEIKRRRCRGDEYFTRTGKLVSKKVFQMIDCKCRRNCTMKVPKEVRKKIFEEYHAMADWNSQTQFIVASVVVTDVKRKRLRKPDGEEDNDHVSRRATSRVFYLTNKKIQVCKPVFMSTLGITGKRVDYALRVKAIPMTAIATPDRRGKKKPKNKTSIEVEERIKAHINSFPSASSMKNLSSSGKRSSSFSEAGSSSFIESVDLDWPSSTAASNSSLSAKSSKNGGKGSLSKNKGSSKATQLHLPAELTITKMYQLYQEQCELDNVTPASMWVYTKILHAESKFRSVQNRHSHSHHSNTSTTTTTTTTQPPSLACEYCDRSYSILTCGAPPERIIELLMEEHRCRRLLASSPKPPSKCKTASDDKARPSTSMDCDD